MKIYDGNFLNLKVNDKPFMTGAKVTETICLNNESIIAGDNIVVTQLGDSKIEISILGAVEPDIPDRSLYFTTSYSGVFTMFLGSNYSGNVDIFYHMKDAVSVNIDNSAKAINQMFKKPSTKRTYIDDTYAPLTIFKVIDKRLTSLYTGSNIELETIDVKNNLLEVLDLSMNTNLVSVDISGNPISDINCNSLVLKEFIANNTELSSIKLISHYLETLDLTNCVNLSSFDVDLSGIRYIHMGNTGIKSIDLSNSPELVSFDVSSSDVTSIVINNSQNIENYNFEGCYIDNFIATNVNFIQMDVLNIMQKLYDSGVHNGTLILMGLKEFEDTQDVAILRDGLTSRGWFVRISETYSESSSGSGSESSSESDSGSESYSEIIDIFIPRIISYNYVKDTIMVKPQILVDGVYVDDPDRAEIEVEF